MTKDQFPITKASSAGFTLVELLLTLAILVTVSTAALVQVNHSNVSRELRQSAEQLRQTLYQTRNLALAPAVDKTVGSSGYRLIFTGPNAPVAYTGYTIVEMGETGKVVSQDTLKVGLEYFLPTTPETTGITFSIADHAAITDPQPSSGVVTLVVRRSDGTGDQYQISVSTVTGQVEHQAIEVAR